MPKSELGLDPLGGRFGAGLGAQVGPQIDPKSCLPRLHVDVEVVASEITLLDLNCGASGDRK